MPMTECINKLLITTNYANDKMHRWQSASSTKYASDKICQWQNALTAKCAYDKIDWWQNAWTAKCTDDKMCQWQNVPMTKCANDKMFQWQNASTREEISVFHHSPSAFLFPALSRLRDSLQKCRKLMRTCLQQGHQVLYITLPKIEKSQEFSNDFQLSWMDSEIFR